MFSVATTSSRQGQGLGKNYPPQVPKGFTVRVFKGPVLSSFSHPTNAKFDRGYHSIPLAEPRQSQNWYPSRSQNVSISTSAPSEPPKSSRTQAFASLTNNNRLGGYETNSRPSSYTIYQGTKDTYVYEASLSSKSDLYSNGDYDASTANFTPSTISAAMSTDSITTLRGVPTPDISHTNLPPSLTAPTRNSFQFPALQSAIKGIFRTQIPPEPQSSRTSNFTSKHPTPYPGSSEAGRSTASGRQLNRSSGSGDRSVLPERSSQPYTRARSPVSEISEHTELDRIAKVNAEYNAASSASSSAYYSARDSVSFASVSSMPANGLSDRTRQVYPNLPLRSSPEQQNAHAHYATLRTGVVAREASPNYAESDQRSGPHDDTRIGSLNHYTAPNSSLTTVSSQYNASSDERRGRERGPSSTQHRSEEVSPSRIPEVRHEAPPSLRNYVPSSRTVLSAVKPLSLSSSLSELKMAAQDNEVQQGRPLPIPPPATQPQCTSEQERVTPMTQAPIFQPDLPLPYIPSDGSTVRNAQPASRENERGQAGIPVPKLAPFPSLGDDPEPPLTREQSPLRLSPQPMHRFSSTQNSLQTQFAAVEPSGEQSSIYVPSSFTRLPSNTGPAQVPPPRASPEQIHAAPPSNPFPTHHAREHSSSPPAGDIPPTYVPSIMTRLPSTALVQVPPLKKSPVQIYAPPAPAAYTHAAIQQNHPASLPPVPITSTYVPSSLTRLPNTSPPRARSDSIANPVRISPLGSFVAVATSPTSGQNHTQSNVHNSPPRNQNGPQGNQADDLRSQQSIAHGLGAGQPPIDGNYTDEINQQNLNERLTGLSYQTYYQTTAVTSVSQRHIDDNKVSTTQARYNNEQRPLDSRSDNQANYVSSISIGSSMIRQRKASISEPQRARGENYIQPQPVQAFPNTSVPSEAALIRSRPQTSGSLGHLPDPQRRYSYGDRSTPPSHPAPSTALSEPLPQRRYSDGDQPIPSSNNTLSLFRTVRWNENLVCPSPIFPHQRRKGWFNRRGDQLWTNDGAYKPPPTGQEYPPDLDGYPEHGEGWMNEECVRIDMGHHLIPKAPLKSALKQSKNVQPDS